MVLLRLSRPGDPLVPTASGLPPFPRDAFALRPLGEAADVPLFDILAVCRKKLPMPVWRRTADSVFGGGVGLTTSPPPCGVA